MLAIDTLRGADSTGVFGVSNKGNVEILKQIGTGIDFIFEKDFESFSNKAIGSGQFVVGHNRAATRGNITDDNAHPFWVDDKIVLVQNGTMRGDHKKHADVEVDSHAIAHILAKEDDVEKALQSIDAAYALVWYNVETKTLNLIRNVERPLYLCPTKSGGWMFASEKEMILFAASRQGVDLAEEPKLIPVGELWQIALSNDSAFTLEKKAINITYMSPFRQGNWEHYRAQNNNRYGMYEFGTEDDEVITHTQPIIRLPHTGSTDIDTTFYTHAWNGKLDEHTLHIADADRLKNKFYALRGRKVLMETLDYLPCNKHAGCLKWYLLGTIMCPDDEINGRIVIYTIINGKTEEEVINMCMGGMYKASLSSTQETHVSVDEVPKRLFHSFTPHLEPVTSRMQ